jgi:valyl-tRNA synthetase
LAARAIEAVRNGETVIYPAYRTADYFRWMENIRDWCISRQLWWGHRIPAWHCACGHITVSREDAKVCSKCGSGEIRQDEDVLDTWFSSGLWPLTCLGWPGEYNVLDRFYPTSLMETGWDILFGSPMMMFGLHFTGQVRFGRYTRWCRRRRQKMSRPRATWSIGRAGRRVRDRCAFIVHDGGAGERHRVLRAREGYRLLQQAVNAARFASMKPRLDLHAGAEVLNQPGGLSSCRSRSLILARAGAGQTSAARLDSGTDLPRTRPTSSSGTSCAAGTPSAGRLSDGDPRAPRDGGTSRPCRSGVACCIR